MLLLLQQKFAQVFKYYFGSVKFMAPLLTQSIILQQICEHLLSLSRFARLAIISLKSVWVAKHLICISPLIMRGKIVRLSVTCIFD